MDKAVELQANGREHVDAWPASGSTRKAYGEQHG